MKLSHAAIVLASSGLLSVNAQSTCTDTIGLAQICIKGCIDTGYTESIDYSNQLFYCLDQGSGPGRAVQLETCCGMTGDCSSSLQNAQTCLDNELVDVKDAAMDYLTCSYRNKMSGVCGFADFCLALLVGGTGMGEQNDFSVAKGSDLAVLAGNAQTCSDMDIFGKNACDTVAFCCIPCAEKIADVVNAITNDILLPTYNSNGLTECEGKTCSEFFSDPATRQLDTTDEESAADVISIPDGALGQISKYATACSDALTIDIATFNQTYAIDNYLPCLYKAMGTIMADIEKEKEAEEKQTESEETSAEPSASGFLSGAIWVASAALGSAIFAALA